MPTLDQLYNSPQDLELLIQQLGQLVPAPELPPVPLTAQPLPPMQPSLGQMAQPGGAVPPPQVNPFETPPPAALPAQAAGADDDTPAQPGGDREGRLADAIAALQNPIGNVPQPPADILVNPNFQSRGTSFPIVGNANAVQNQMAPLYQGFQPAGLGPSLGQLIALSRGG